MTADEMKRRLAADAARDDRHLAAAKIWFEANQWPSISTRIPIELVVSGKPCQAYVSGANGRLAAYLLVYNGRKTVMGAVRKP